jgi:Vps51/Vps67
LQYRANSLISYYAKNTSPTRTLDCFAGASITKERKVITLNAGLKHDIDQKREELRTMVGERYRDLMEAADTIAQMKVR